MTASGDREVRDTFRQWAEEMDCHQYHILVETAKMVELLKQKKVSAKTKNEIIIVIKGLHATVKSVHKVLSQYIE